MSQKTVPKNCPPSFAANRRKISKKMWAPQSGEIPLFYPHILSKYDVDEQNHIACPEPYIVIASHDDHLHIP